MRLQVLINSTFESEKALINVDTKKILLKGDYYHNQISELIEGFLMCLDYLKVEYELLDSQYIIPDMEMFNMCDL